MDESAQRRGSYAKGVAKREEILRRALDVVASEGFHGASVKELADAVGLSQAGLLHYFESKAELFTEILRKRDDVDAERFGLYADQTRSAADARTGFVGIIRHNADVPGLVQLFARLSVEAGDAEHPAHAFFAQRGAQLRGAFTDVVAREQAAGTITDRVPAETISRILQAVADGMQVQWMLDPTVDMAGVVDAVFDLLDARPAASDPTQEQG